MLVKAVTALAVVAGLMVAAAPTALAADPPTTLVSVTPGGVAAEDRSDRPHISGDGNVVAFDSSANNVVPQDWNGVKDAFIRDMTTGLTERVSVSSFGTQGNQYSTLVSINGDGRYVAFQSLADNLVSGDTNGNGDIFVRDRTTSTTTLISVDRFGGPAAGTSTRPSISADGTKVTWNSRASDLVAGDTNGLNDIFVRDLTTGITSRIMGSGGAQPNGVSVRPEFSDDGNIIVFESYATNLLPQDNDTGRDIYWYNLTTGQLQIASINAAGNPVNGSSRPHVSADGRYVTFQSQVPTVVPGDTNDATDVFRRDMQAGVTVRISQSSSGVGASSEATRGVLSANGRYVVFNSFAANLVPGDTNSQQDIFLRDVDAGTTILVSRRADGVKGSNGNSYRPELSDDGTKVAYRSAGDNFTSNDNNGTWDIYYTDVTLLGGGGGGGGDTAPPDASIASPVGGSTVAGDPALLAGEATDDVAVASVEVIVKDRVSKLYLQANGSFAAPRVKLPTVLSAPSTPSTGWSTSVTLPAGDYALEAVTFDTAGKKDPSKPRVIFTVSGGGGGGGDTAPPDASIASPVGGSTVAGDPALLAGEATDDVAVASVEVIVKDRVSKLYLQANGSFAAPRVKLPTVLSAPSTPSTGWSTSVTLPAGDYALEAVTFDTAGKKDPSKPRVIFTVSGGGGGGGDTAPPDASIASPVGGSTVAGDPALLAGEATDDVAVASVEVIVKDRVSKLYLQANGSFAAPRVKLPTVLSAPGTAVTGWSTSVTLPAGNYAVEAVTFDTAGKKDPDKPWVIFVVA